MNPSTVELRAGDLHLALRPDLGGAIAGLWHGATPVLRSTAGADLTAASQAACYPLVPYSNRIGQRRFQWQGQEHRIAANFEGSPHALHGVARLRAWDVLSSSPAEAELRYRHTPDADWPFAFDVHQRFRLTGGGLTVSMAFTNTADQAQPVGLGWHPYFPKRPAARLHISVVERWNNDASGLTTQAVPQDAIHSALAELDLDHCFGGWQGPAEIADAQLALRLSASLPYVVIYTPPMKPFYCVEPVSHVSNAIQRADPAAHGLRTLVPGATFEAWMQLDIAAA